MYVKQLLQEIKLLKKQMKEGNKFARFHLKGIEQTINMIEGFCVTEEDGLEVYENRHHEGKGDGIWINALDLIKIKVALTPIHKTKKYKPVLKHQKSKYRSNPTEIDGMLY